MSCPICEKRPPKRFCPAKGEKICAICCGEQREVTIDCPHDCTHLLAARRYEAEHRQPLSPDEMPYRGVDFSVDYIYERWPVVAGIAGTVLAFSAENRELNDAAILTALEALAETYRTLGTGIYYECPPDAHLPHALYSQISGFLQEARKQEAGRAGLSPAFSSIRDGDIFNLLVFLLRVGKQQTNARPKSRAFLDFLRAKFPAPAEATKDAPRIIVP
jgi:hypothetical protein